jgi:hypothetical protein
LDSLDLETQNLKRAGKPIDDVEAERAMLQDSIRGLRGVSPADDAPARPGGGFGWDGTFAAFASFLGTVFSFKPSGLFDWVIVGTGAVALLSAALLFIGLVAGRRKGAAARKVAEPARKINLAPPTGRQQAVPDALPASGAAYNYNGLPAPAAPPPQVPPEWEALMRSARGAAASPPPDAAPPPTVAPPPKPTAPSSPSPLIVEGTGSSAVSARRGAIPGVGSPGFAEQISADSKSGLSDVEISRNYKISVEQVKLMLRMRQE